MEGCRPLVRARPCWLLLLLLLVLLTGAGQCVEKVSSRFVGLDVSSSVVYPVRVDRYGRDRPQNRFRSSATIKKGILEPAFPHHNPRARRNERARQRKFLRFKRHSVIETPNTDTSAPFSDGHKSNYFIPENSSPRNPTFNTVTENEEQDNFFIRIANEDEDLFLKLRPNRNLQTRGTVIEWVLPGGVTILKQAPADCYLVGRSVGDNDRNSLVAVSGCSGLTGFIKTSRNSYFIEPLDTRKEEGETGSDFGNFIERLRNHSGRFGDDPPLRGQVDSESQESADERRGYQYQRTSQEILTLLEPHVIYKVNTILERLNISLHEDQKYHWDKSPSSSRRQRRSVKYTTDGQQGSVRLTATAKKMNRKNRKADKKARDRKRQQKRKRRHGRRNRDLRRRCRELSEAPRDEDGGDPDYSSRHDDGDLSEVADVDGSNAATTEEAELERLCWRGELKRQRRREVRRRRRNEREEKQRQRAGKREERQRKKKEKKEERKRRKLNAKMDGDEYNRRHGSNPGPDTLWDRFNLTGEEWQGGYSPDLPWNLVQPAHSPTVLEEDLSKDDSFEDESPRGRRSSPKRWLEVTVAVDSSVVDFHGQDETERYIFTLFNIVSAIYQDPSLGSNLDLVLLRLICYTDPQQSQVRPGEAKASLEAVNRWASRLHRASQPSLRHDMAVWLTRYPLGGPSGYAPVGGVCHSTRSCTLNRDEGLTSAFIIAHEMGHVLGMSHDGDGGSANTCVSEGVTGSVMAPLVAATFTRFHWSRCSRREYRDLVSSWDCMTSPPSWVNASTVSPVVSYHYSLDDQCRMEFGEGFGLCRSSGLSDSCSHLWCANASASHLCKTKKGPPLEGTVCGEGKWCRYGSCTSRGVAHHPVDGTTTTPAHNTTSSRDRHGGGGGVTREKGSGSSPVRHNPRDGRWGEWSEWGPCSTTCGVGVAFKIRNCDNPSPLYGGERCRGKREEWRICGDDECTHTTDVREAHCADLNNLVQLDDRRAALHWLPYESKNRRNKCRVSCYSRATNEVFMGQENVRDGTSCSYDGPSHHVCVQGKCVELGCDLVGGSGLEEDVCGVCGGAGDTCRTLTDEYYDTPPMAYTVVSVLPAGARHVAVREGANTTNFLALAAAGWLTPTSSNSFAGTSDSDDLSLTADSVLLNPDGKQGPARAFRKGRFSTTVSVGNERP